MLQNITGERMNLKKGLQYFILSGLVYFVVTMPVRHFFSLMPVAEMRPAAVFPPLFGMLYGFWGAFGGAVARERPCMFLHRLSIYGPESGQIFQLRLIYFSWWKLRF